ncbi:uncharacterized protein DSM5745_06168 [Aspergillus mulundensis]|uniref:Zn(II)2Cys6 transcription factor n=1 Tax=Aspergillus mulundensis TaxID=1810919 RepID=A0A3D8RZ55_9EURO|nr:Uncharacterized protein DSM5745_06168 [Aspergillus mulundensis]RDW79316.1 Uncharacterized protein DSM5745_06168 [Aspergillus mulundensis]
MSSRECSFSTESTSTGSCTSLPSPTNTGNGPQTPCSSVSESTPDSVLQLHAIPADAPINIQHAELLIHLTSPSASDIFSLGDGVEPYQGTISQALKTGLKAPYLLHQLLAFSACHLAYLHPDKRPHYSHQATALQTRAIALFNAQKIDVSKENCVAICLFSVVLGHHLLAETLAVAHSCVGTGGIDAFLSRYVQSLSTHRGVFTVAMTGWTHLMSSELSSILLRSQAFTSAGPRGTECHGLRVLVLQSPTLDDGEKGACLAAIRYLQLGFDALSTGLGPGPGKGEHENMRFQMLFLWNVLVPPRYTALLARKNPEALIVLAYYALLLHHGRHIWQVGEAGRYIFGMIEEDLGAAWDAWLEYPRVGLGTRVG